MSRAAQHGRKAGKAAGDNPVAAVGLLCLLAFLAGYWWLAVLVIVVAVLATDIEDALLAWWDGVGSLTKCGVYLGALVGAYLAVTLDVQLWQVVAAGAALTVGAMGSAWWWWRNRVFRQHYREYVLPLHEALTDGARAPLPELAEARPTAYINVPLDMLEAEGGIVLTLPRGPIPNATRKAAIVEATTAVCGLTDVRTDWRFKGQARWLRLTSKATVPLEVLFSTPEVRAMVERSADSRPLLALATGDRKIAVDFDAESPHFLIAAGTGVGKSALLRLIVAQALHHGAGVVICDIKRTSQHWAKGLPGVRYARTVAEVHAALVDAGREVERRLEVAEGFGPDEVGTWPRLLVVCEEWALTWPELVEYWREVRDRDDPKRSPAVRAYRMVLLAGRSSKVNAVVVTQRGDAQELGGGNARTQFATRVVGRHDKNAWRLLMGDSPFVTPSKRRGRVWVSLHGTVTECQVVFMSEAEAIDYATSGRKNPVTVAMSRSSRPPGETLRDGRGRPPLELVPDDVDDDRVTLPEASTDKGDALVPLTYDSLRAARDGRDPEFPPHLGAKRGKAWVYSLDQLQRWAANRERTGTETDR